MSDMEQPGETVPTASAPATDSAAPEPRGLDDEIGLDVIESLAEEGSDAAVPAWPLPAEHAPAPGEARPASEAPIALEAVKNMGQLLARRLDVLQTLFERELRAEATRERVIDRLHAELQEYKNDFLLKIQRPIFVDLIQLHDDIAKMIEAKATADDEAESAAGLRGVLESIQTAIEDILYRQGVEPFVSEGNDVRSAAAACGLHGAGRRTSARTKPSLRESGRASRRARRSSVPRS